MDRSNAGSQRNNPQFRPDTNRAFTRRKHAEICPLRSISIRESYVLFWIPNRLRILLPKRENRRMMLTGG